MYPKDLDQSMNSATTESIALCCDYCGRENSERSFTCPGCGTSLVISSSPDDAEPQGKSTVGAVFFALLLGPLGLLYVKAWIPAIVLFLTGLVLISQHMLGVGFLVGVRVVSAVIAYHAAVKLNKVTGQIKP